MSKTEDKVYTFRSSEKNVLAPYVYMSMMRPRRSRMLPAIILGVLFVAGALFFAFSGNVDPDEPVRLRLLGGITMSFSAFNVLGLVLGLILIAIGIPVLFSSSPSWFGYAILRFRHRMANAASPNDPNAHPDSCQDAAYGAPPYERHCCSAEIDGDIIRWMADSSQPATRRYGLSPSPGGKWDHERSLSSFNRLLVGHGIAAFESVVPTDWPETDGWKAYPVAPAVIVDISDMSKDDIDAFCSYAIERMHDKGPWLLRC